MNLDFVAAFANNPITLAILVVGAAVVVFITKGAPLLKELSAGNDHLSEKMDTLLASDKEQTAAISDIQVGVKNNTLDILRITIYNESLDIEDRLVAARRYVISGGNGKVAPYIAGLAKANPDIWRTIVAMSSNEERKALEDLYERHN
jgi:hypothetical protein